MVKTAEYEDVNQMVKRRDPTRPVVNLVVDPIDVIAVGGPSIGEAEVVLPLVQEIRERGGSNSQVLIIVYNDGADVSGAEMFRNCMIREIRKNLASEADESPDNVSRETIPDMEFRDGKLMPYVANEWISTGISRDEIMIPTPRRLIVLDWAGFESWSTLRCDVRCTINDPGADNLWYWEDDDGEHRVLDYYKSYKHDTEVANNDS